MSHHEKFDPAQPPAKVPSAALRLAATAELGERSSDDTNTAPVRLRARSADPIDHWYWGKIAHDLSGFELTGDQSKVALLYDHEEPIGYALKKHIDVDGDYGLTVNGTLVAPRASAGPNRAMQLIDQMAAGIPFESSISFAGGSPTLEQVDEGETSEVNGREFKGPGVIVRSWPLREVSIVTSGADADTESALLSQSDQVSVEFITRSTKEQIMSESNSVAIEDSAAVVDESVDMAADNDSGEAVELTAVEPQAIDQPGVRYIEAFGEIPGAVYFTKGLTFESACLEHIQAQATEIEDLKNQLSVVKVAADGEHDACSFNDGDVEPKPTFTDLSRRKKAR